MDIGRFDPINMNMNQCKKLFLEYQKTRDKKLFELILLKYDRFIIFSVRKFKKSHYCLIGEDLQDLYQVSILGFYKAILSVRRHHRVDKLNFRISSYIKKELRMAYDYKKKKFSGDVIWDKDPTDKFEKDLQGISMNLIINTMILSEKERQIIKMRFVEERTYKEIGKVFSMTPIGVSKNIARTIEKLRMKLKNEEFDH